jgi:hypothetical protein
MFTNLRSRTFLVHTTAVCTVAFLIAACGGAGEDDSTGAASDTAVENDPLMAGLLDGKTFEEAELEVQTKVQECMTALGWEYTAVAPGSTGEGGPTLGDDTDLDEFAATSGYGISTSQADGAIVVGGGGVAAGVSGTSSQSDPNSAYVNSLSENDQMAYYDDLFGPPAEFDMSSDAMAPMEPAGCMGEATTAVYGEGAFTQLNDQFMEVDARMQADPRIVEAFAAWSACMADAGYTYSKPTETFDDFFARLSALGEEPDPAALKTLQEEEIATATADRACAKETDIETIQQEVFQEISTEVASGS